MSRKPEKDAAPVRETSRLRPPTMADIARLAGVSASTVSRSLAGLPPISEETRVRVENAARQAGYKINRHARSLRLQRSAILLVLIPDLANQNYSDLLKNLDKVAFELGYGLMIGHTGNDLERPDRLADELFTGGIDGILLTSSYCPSRIRDRLELGERLPVVRTLSPTEIQSGIASVQIDEAAAAADVVRHLIANGHQRIAHLEGPPIELVSRLRREGWQRAMAEAGLPAEPGLLYPGGFRLEDGREVARSLLAAGTLPDAIFCANDESAYGLMTELKSAGMRIPQDIAVAGFDDLPFSEVFDPPLTTVRLPRREMAEVSILYLKQLIEEDAEIEQKLVSHQLIVRGSSGPLERQSLTAPVSPA